MHNILTSVTGVLSAVCILVVCAGSGIAQIVVEETILTDSVDLFTPTERDTTKSATLAMLASLVVPGLGQQYLERPRRALTYFSSELLLIFGAVLCESYSRRLSDDAHTIAWLYAGARGGSGTDDNYWRAVGTYLDADGYNRVQELNRTPEDKYADPHLQWAWVDEEYQDEYVATRDDATSFHVASTFFVGAMVLNRLVSFVDARLLTMRRRSTSRTSHLRFDPRYDIESGTVGMTLSGSF